MLVIKIKTKNYILNNNHMIYYLFIFIILCIIINYYQSIEIMANNSDLEWLVVGDIGVFGDNFYKLIRNQKNGNQEFINILGDNFYPNGIDRINLHFGIISKL